MANRNQQDPLPSQRCMEIGKACACFNLRKASRAITHLYDTILEPTGLKAAHFTLLMAMKLRGSSQVATLANMTAMDRTTTTRALAHLEKQGLVQRDPGKDGREREAALTKKGSQTLLDAILRWEQAQARVAASLGEMGLAGLLADLSHLIGLGASSPLS